MDVPLRPVTCEVTRHGWMAEIALNEQAGPVNVAAMEDAWSRVLTHGPTRIVVIDMTTVGVLDDAVAVWLIDSQRRSASLDVELFVLAPRGEARDKLRRHAVGGIVTLIDGP